MSSHPAEALQAQRMEPLFSIDETAEFLGISRRQVYTLLERGELPNVRVGQRTRFIPADLRAYLAEQRESSPEMPEAGFPASEPLADENVDGNRSA